MSFYSVKLQWSQPKEGTDQMQKISKNFLVSSESVTEAELRMNQWVPGNYQDAIVDEVKKTQVVELKQEGACETFWSIKLLMDNDGRERAKPFLIVLNGNSIDEIVKKLKDNYSDCEVVAVQKFVPVVDEDLVK